MIRHLTSYFFFNNYHLCSKGSCKILKQYRKGIIGLITSRLIPHSNCLQLSDSHIVSPSPKSSVLFLSCLPWCESSSAYTLPGVVSEPTGKMEETRAIWSDATGSHSLLHSLWTAIANSSWELCPGEFLSLAPQVFLSNSFRDSNTYWGVVDGYKCFFTFCHSESCDFQPRTSKIKRSKYSRAPLLIL